MKMNKTTERRRKISQLLFEKKAVSTKELIDRFGVSKETIRKDLHYLQNEGILKRRYGLVELVVEPESIAKKELEPVAERSPMESEEKERIVMTALKHLPANTQRIGLDYGSTVSLLALHLRTASPKHIFTGSLAAILELANSHHDLYCLGGHYYDDYMAFQNDSPIDLYPDVTLDVSFFGSGGVLNRDGFCTANLIDAQVKKRLFNKSKKKIVLLDNTKFESTSLFEVAKWDEVDLVITNKETPRSIQRELAAKTRLLSV